eukprot:SAG31_NODE_9285_length_1304_cov_1.281328_1_plen_32_part_10
MSTNRFYLTRLDGSTRPRIVRVVIHVMWNIYA